MNFTRFDNFFNIDENILLKEFSEKLIIRLKMLYDTYKDFIVLKDIKEYLLKLNNNQRTNYQFKIFKIIFTRIIADEIKKTLLIITITRTILIIEAIFISTIKSKQNTTFKNLMCYNCDKADYYKKNYTIQDQIEANKKMLNKARLYNLDIDDK